MISSEVIRMLQEADPTGQKEVCVNNMDIQFIETQPAYYDGSLQVLQRDSTKKGYNIVGGKYLRSGDKVVIHTLSIHDAIGYDPDIQVDYSELPESLAEITQNAHEQLRFFCRTLDFNMEQGEFVEWALLQASNLTSDIEEVKDLAKAFYQNHFSPSDPVKIKEGNSRRQARHQQWEQQCQVVLNDGFLEIVNK